LDARYALNASRDVLGGLLRSSIADYEVIRALPLTGAGQARYLGRAPERLGVSDPVMITELAVDAAGWRDLTTQLSRLAAVGSDRLLALYEVGPDLDAQAAGVYLVSEAGPGGNAHNPSEPFDGTSRIRAVAEAARGAHAMHEAGLVHGSIGSGSIFLTTRGAALGPPTFGRPTGEVGRMRDWRSLVVLDPALLRGEEPSRSSDVWALAATLHELLSRRPLYPGIADDPGVTAVQRVLFTRPEIDPALPYEVAQTLTSILVDDQAERPLTAEDLADRLMRAGALA
jgi:serine/threonine protein kinase